MRDVHLPSLRARFRTSAIGGWGIALSLWVLCASPSAHAAGLQMAGHGVRGLARAGAFTAGGDDPGGIWYNPANIGGVEGIQLLVDASFVLLHLEYQRVDSGGNLLPPINAGGSKLPIPTVGLATSLLKRKLSLGFSFSAPYSPLPVYPEPNYAPCADPANPVGCIATAHADAPQRYTLVSTEGTMFLQLDLAAAYEVWRGLWVGASLQNLFASYITRNTISSYNGALSSGPEDPEFDSLSQTELIDLFNPSAKFGVLYQPHPMVRIGASVQLPFWIGGEATVKVQLPTSPVYEKSSVEGDRADMEVTFPLVLRLGVELRPMAGLRVEVGFDYEMWSMLQAIKVTPQNIYILDIPSVDRYKVPALEIPLNFRNTFTLRLGGEYTLQPFPLTLRGGFIFERGAVEGEYASVLALDSDKYMLTLGLGYSLFGYRLDLLYAHEFKPERVVDFRESKSMQINPINPAGAVGVGGGSYRSSTDVIGVGLSKTF